MRAGVACTVLSETAAGVRRQGWLYILFGLEGLKRGAHARVAAHVGGAAGGTWTVDGGRWSVGAA